MRPFFLVIFFWTFERLCGILNRCIDIFGEKIFDGNFYVLAGSPPPCVRQLLLRVTVGLGVKQSAESAVQSSGSLL